jgi:hypothetical protein
LAAPLALTTHVPVGEQVAPAQQSELPWQLPPPATHPHVPLLLHWGEPAGLQQLEPSVQLAPSGLQ